MVLPRELLHWLVVSYSIALWSGVAAFTSWDWPWDIHFCNNILFWFYLVCIVFVCILSKRPNEHSFVIILLWRVTILANNRCGGRHLVLTVFCYRFYYMHLSHVKNLMSFLFSKCNDFYFYKCYMFFCPVKRRLEYIWIWGLLALRNHVCRIPEDFKIVSTYNWNGLKYVYFSG